MLLRAFLLAALLVVLPLALAQPTNTVDYEVVVEVGARPSYDGPLGILRLEASEAGERYVWNLSSPREYIVGEFILKGFDVERARQVVPTLEVPGIEYPLFERFPHERLWEVDGPARVYHMMEREDGSIQLRLGIPGPVNGTLTLTRDVAPPTYELGPVSQLTHFSFYQETTTRELALADLQVRAVGAEEWVRNPTPVYHFLQKFPVQGLDPDTEYEARVVFTDWAGNEATSEKYLVRTAPEPVRPVPVVRPVSPAPNATLAAADVVVRAGIESPNSSVRLDGIRLFFDLKEVRDGFAVDNGTLVYVPSQALLPGVHVVSVEVTNVDGGRAVSRWTFEVPGATTQAATPGPGAAWVGLVLLGAALLARRR